ncbi:MAG: hypothetical protein LBQ66_01000 [Planctomycetaceae bacterium]|nr:hypothetical protein [Planctomycetaceae bacterium]
MRPPSIKIIRTKQPIQIKPKIEFEKEREQKKMSGITEKFNVALNQFNNLQSKFVPLGQSVELLTQKLNTVTQSIAELEVELLRVKLVTDGANNDFASIAEILNELQTDTEKLNHNIEENETLRESMTTMFGEAFNVVSKFINTAKQIGIIDNDRANQILSNNSTANTINTTTENITPEIIDESNNENIPDPHDIHNTSDTVEKSDEVDNPPVNISDSLQTESAEKDFLTSSEMANQLDLPPLQFGTPANTDNNLPNTTEDFDNTNPDNTDIINNQDTNPNTTINSNQNTEDDLEAILDDISKPLSTS